MDKPSEVIGVGLACIDHLSIVSHGEDGSEVCTAPLVQGGGLVATATVAVARLGGLVEIWTEVGDDHHGRFVKKELADFGVCVDAVRVVPGARTPSSFIEVDAITGERTIYWTMGQGVYQPSPEPRFDLGRIAKARSVLVDVAFLPVAMEAAAVAKREGVVVVADLFELGGPCTELVRNVDALIIPEEAARRLVGGEDYPGALEEMAQRGPSMPAITVGPRGCWYLADDGVYHCPAFPVTVVDTTGCGDSFHGAFAFAMTRGMDVHEAIRFSSAVAGLKATKLGGRTGLPTLAEVERFLEERPSQGRARRVA